jgi:hypothetical protein
MSKLSGAFCKKDKICAKNNKAAIYTGKHKWYKKTHEHTGVCIRVHVLVKIAAWGSRL